MREGGAEPMNWWVPKEGDIVRLKPGFDHGPDAHGMRRANVHELQESRLYRVKEYIQNEEQRALALEEVRVIHIAGKRIVTKISDVSFTPPKDFFELAREHQGE
jgi:hypothetical protein